MSDDRLILALPSKGRLMEKTLKLFADHGMTIKKTGHERGYRGIVEEYDDIDIAFLSASEIAQDLRSGRIHMGVTGEDLVRENIADHYNRVSFVKPLGFGQADVVVAVPQCWLDVQTIADLEEIAGSFQQNHGHRLRVASKYINLTRRFFTRSGFFGYRIVGSLGATEGAPASGNADLIVDITSSGETLRANHLKILTDGVILKSQASLVASHMADWSGNITETRQKIEQLLAPVGQDTISE